MKSLIGELTDLSRLSRFPSPPYVTRQSSSYDRASTSPAHQEAWFANGDSGHFVKVESRGGRKEFVLLEAEGPGATVRLWSANPEGNLRVYIDGGDQPALEAPMGDLLRGKVQPFAPPLACEVSKGCNLYFPIPYARRCQITSDRGGFYYHVNYRTYPPGTAVESFSMAKLAALKDDIDQAAAALAQPDKLAGPGAQATRADFRLEVKGSAGARVAFIKTGPQSGEAIRRLELRPSAVDPETLRSTILAMSFDGEETVRAPLGDFFGTGPGLNPYQSLPLSVSKDGVLTCRWFMPFRERADLELRALGGKELQVAGHALHAPEAWTDRSLLFHAKWRSEQEMKTAPPRDWNYVAIEGQGLYAGNVLNVANPVKAWWGEGDEKIYVDGESFPSHFGTGTEDYYGYAWGWQELFTHAYHNQTRCDGPGTFGHTSVNRWHVVDDIPFTRSFRFDMEVWHWNRKIQVSYDTVNYWYARPGAKDNIAPPPPEALAIPVLPERKPLAIAGAIEGETLAQLEKTGGVADSQEMSPFEGQWSRDHHLWWREARPGDRLVLGFDAPKAGKYRLIARLTKAVDYGIHQLKVNGRKAGDPVDLWNDGVIPFELDLGTFDLETKGNRLEVEITGTNDRARPKNYMFGLDCLILK